MTTEPMVKIINDELLIIRLSGEVNRQTLHDLARELIRVGGGKEFPKQLVYVEDITSATITSDDALFFRSQRPERHAPGKSAFCAFNELQYGMARMFQAILESELHTIEIFRDIPSAAAWLEIDSALLERKNQ